VVVAVAVVNEVIARPRKFGVVVLGAEAEGVVREGIGPRKAFGVEELAVGRVLIRRDDSFRVRIDQRRDVAVVVADDRICRGDGEAFY